MSSTITQAPRTAGAAVVTARSLPDPLHADVVLDGGIVHLSHCRRKVGFGSGSWFAPMADRVLSMREVREIRWTP